MREVLPLGDEPLVQLAGEQWDAVPPGVMAEPVAGHADLTAVALRTNGLIEVGQGSAESGNGRTTRPPTGVHQDWQDKAVSLSGPGLCCRWCILG